MGDEAGTWAAAVDEVRSGGAPAEAAAGLVARMTEDERLGCLHGSLPFWAGLADLGTGGYHRRPFPAAAVPRLGVPGFAFSDGPRGVVIGNATCFPVSMARGASWDLDLEERIGDAIGQELRAMGADLYGGVCVNVLRHPAWGRAQETYGEDPVHVGELGAALTRGVQRHAMACVKHLACNSMENARFQVDVRVDDTALHEVYLPHFRRIVEEGVACVMSAYNRVNGEWAGDSRPLLTDVLRDEWGFDGYVISDWYFGLRDAAASVRSGLDVEMPSPMVRRAGVRTALEAGELGWADVDAVVTRTMAALLRFAASPAGQAPPPPRSVLADPAHRALAREAAAKSVVVLQNRGLLPLDAGRMRRIAVLGELAVARNLGDGGSSDVWAPDVVTVLDGFRAAAPEAAVEHDPGADPERAAGFAAEADLAVVVVGYTRDDEGEFIGASGTSHLGALFPGPDDPEEVAAFEARVAAEGPPLQAPTSQGGADVGGFSEGGDRRSLRLHQRHEDLIAAVAAANPRTLVLVVAGSAVVMEGWRHAVPALAMTWYSGMEGGHGIADVLFGAVDASGRLPFSIPTDEAHLPAFDPDAEEVTYDAWHGYWHLQREGHEPAFPFGFGRSYTRWDHDEPVADRVAGGWDVRTTVANTGPRPGSTVVQLYAGRGSGDVRPRRLVGFARVELAPGTSTEVAIHLPDRALEVRDAGRWRPGEGPVTIAVGFDSASTVTGSLSSH